MEEEQFGDLVVRKSPPDQGGFDVLLLGQPGAKPKKICFFNGKGTIALKDWIEDNFEE